MLLIACLATFAINLDTTIVNVALPAMARAARAGTTDLQWIVDAYNLAFAGARARRRQPRRPLRPAPGPDRRPGRLRRRQRGRRLCARPGALIATRLGHGSLRRDDLPDDPVDHHQRVPRPRRERAKAIGIWGAVVGVAVAVGPVTGGLLLEHFWWGTCSVALVPLSRCSPPCWPWLARARVARPARRRRSTCRGRARRLRDVGTLVYTIIEAPRPGLGARPDPGRVRRHRRARAGASPPVERRAAHPMIDLSLFRTPRSRRRACR